MARIHVADEIAEEILERIERQATDVAEAVLGSPLSPVTQKTTAAEELAIYRSLLFTPDGLPNPAGRDELMAKVGSHGYERIALALARQHEEVP
jgi:hypothetical protein